MHKLTGLMPRLLAMASILLFARSDPAAEPKPQSISQSCPMKKLVSLDVQVNQRGQILVPVNIEGHDAWMSLNLEDGLLSLYGAAIVSRLLFNLIYIMRTE